MDPQQVHPRKHQEEEEVDQEAKVEEIAKYVILPFYTYLIMFHVFFNYIFLFTYNLLPVKRQYTYTIQACVSSICTKSYTIFKTSLSLCVHVRCFHGQKEAGRVNAILAQFYSQAERVLLYHITYI